MEIGSKEHCEMIEAFEKFKPGRLDKEADPKLWKIGHIYQDGEVNKMFKFFANGYSFGRCVYLNQ